MKRWLETLMIDSDDWQLEIRRHRANAIKDGAPEDVTVTLAPVTGKRWTWQLWSEWAAD